MLGADGVLAVICVLKGKYRSALFGLFLPPVGGKPSRPNPPAPDPDSRDVPG